MPNKTDKKPSLDELIDDIQVEEPDVTEDHPSSTRNDMPRELRAWWGVSTGDEGTIAYFAKERDAYGFRLYEINRRLNGGRSNRVVKGFKKGE